MTRKLLLAVLALCILLIAVAFIYRDQLTYRYDWFVSAQKPDWWASVDVPEAPEITDIRAMRHYKNQILTEPCCDSDKYKHQRKQLSKVMYAVVMNNRHRPNIAASALGDVGTNMVEGWDRKAVLEFHLRHFYWADYTNCANCMVGDLSWYRVEDLAYLYRRDGDLQGAIDLVNRYLDDRGHELHLRYRIQARWILAKFEAQLGRQQQAVAELEYYLREIQPQIVNEGGIQRAFDRAMQECARVKESECLL